MSALGALVVKLSLDKSEYTAPLQKAASESQQSTNVIKGNFDKVGMSAKAQSAAMRGVPAQVTDIFTALQGGQRPMTVLIQQGGQLKDMFGGIVPATRALGSYILGMVNPLTIAAAAFAAYGYAVYQARDQIQQLTKARIQTGNIAGLTSDEIVQMADDVGKITGKLSAAREAAQELTASGQIAGDKLKLAMQAATDGATVTGMSIKDMSKELVEVAKGPTEGIAKLNEKYNFLTLDIYKHIEALERQGKKQEATAIAFKVFADEMARRRGEIKENLGYMEKAWGGIKRWIDEASTALMNFGREQTKAQQLTAETVALAEMQSAWDSGNNRSAAMAEQIANSKARIAALQGETKATVDAARAQGVKTAADKKAIDEYRRTHKGGVDPFEAGLSGMQRDAAGIQFAIDNFDKFDGKVSASKQAMAEFDVVYGKFSDSIRQKEKLPILSSAQKAAYIEEGRRLDELNDKLRRVNVVKQFGVAINDFSYNEQKNRDGMQFEIDMLDKTKHEVELLTEARRIDLAVQDQIHKAQKDIGAKNVGELDAKIAEIKAAGEVAKRESQAKIEDRYAKENDFNTNMARGLKQYAEDARNYGKQAANWVTSSIDSMADAMAKFVTTGKINFTSLANTMVTELIKIQMRASMSGVASWFGGIFSSGTPGTIDGVGPPKPSAKGNVFDGGAGLSAYSSSIVSKPTLFAFAKGIGLMGEAGSEAIMPLTRGNDGVLGVKAHGVGDGNVSVVVNNNGSNTQASAKEVKDARGNRRIEVTVSDMVAGEMRRPGSPVHSAQRQSFGNRPALVGR